jgi:SAM-dependent methyltransferase
MDTHAQAEVGYWKHDFEYHGGVKGYMAERVLILPHHLEFFGQYLLAEKGPGLDVGTGLVSIFEFLPDLAPVYSIEPLQCEFDKIFVPPDRKVLCVAGSGEDMPFANAQFRFVYCVNVIDHTPRPDRMIAEIRRVLAPGGTLYFQVNFDEELWIGHYRLWDHNTLKDLMFEFTLVDNYEYARLECKQRLYWGVYKK